MIHITEKIVLLDGICTFVDFELDAFSQLDIELELESAATLDIALGEVTSGNRVDRNPGGYRIVRLMSKECPTGKSSFAFDLPRHKSPYANSTSVPLPPEAGNREIVPFRYVEILGGKGKAKLIRKAFYGDFDDNAADFVCDNAQLNRIWQFCKYTMKATSAFGYYIDGERERQPYEGDSLSNLLGDLCCGGSANTAKRTIDWLLKVPTWFNEWQLITAILVRDYLLYSGDHASVRQWLPQLEKHIAKFSLEENNLMRDATPEETAQRLPRDLIDWPRGERDGYELGKFNLTPNCYYFKAMQVMYELTGKNEYSIAAQKVKNAILKNFRNGEKFIDSIGSSHTALHSLLYPAYFKIADLSENMKNSLIAKGMSCSVYTAHFLLEYCFDNGLVEHAYNLLLSNDIRSWNNMLNKGATITMEAWDDTLKPNQDWNHAWGAAPANLIPRCIAGIKPLEPGFKRFAVTPHPGKLKEFYCKHPTPYGAIELEYKQGKYCLTKPADCIAEFEQSLDIEVIS